MPCNCDHMYPHSKEIIESRLLCMLAETEGKTWKAEWWKGYHPKVYNNSGSRNLNALTQKLCSRLKQSDVTKYSLELQLWWRDHQKADKERTK